MLQLMAMVVLCAMTLGGCNYIINNAHNDHNNHNDHITHNMTENVNITKNAPQNNIDLQNTEGFPISKKYYVEEVFTDNQDTYVKVVNKLPINHEASYVCKVLKTFSSSNDTYYLINLNDNPRYVGTIK